MTVPDVRTDLETIFVAGGGCVADAIFDMGGPLLAAFSLPLDLVRNDIRARAGNILLRKARVQIAYYYDLQSDMSAELCRFSRMLIATIATLIQFTDSSRTSSSWNRRQ